MPHNSENNDDNDNNNRNNNHVSDLAQAVTLGLCKQEMTGSNHGQDADKVG
jgi:hypothetical protein